MVAGVRHFADTKIDSTARMADFVRWSVACGLPRFQERYTHNALAATHDILDGDQLVDALKALFRKRKRPWQGSVSQLGEALAVHGFEPENARSLSVRLRRLAPALRSGLGIDVAFGERCADIRPVTITAVKTPSFASFASPPALGSGATGSPRRPPITQMTEKSQTNKGPGDGKQK